MGAQLLGFPPSRRPSQDNMLLIGPAGLRSLRKAMFTCLRPRVLLFFSLTRQELTVDPACRPSQSVDEPS